MVQVSFLYPSPSAIPSRLLANRWPGTSSLDSSATTSQEVTMVFLFVISFVGAYHLTLLSFSFARFILSTFLLPGVSLRKYKAVTGKGNPDAGAGAADSSWAIVTGASDGIGAEFAKQLAKKGFNVVLASRTESKLRSLASEIAASSPSVETKVVAIDFATAGPKAEKGWADLKSAVEGLDVGVLVNNVGVSHSMPVPFAETSDGEIDSIVNVNISSLLKVTKLVLPGMQKRRRGLILNLGSFAGQYPTPLLATYSGSKSFLISWSQALGAEQQGLRTGVDVVALNTYFVVSAMSKIRKSSFLVPTPKQYVSSVLSKVGNSGGAGGRPFSATLWPAHAMVDWALANLLPSEGWLLDYSFGQSLSTRKRALRKAERESKAQ
ncbi:3-ketoacyl-reductase [Ceraceosorus bombacis]|uniref:Very-long-chain 3-oxoacyl-CoA reductase n=1 Tax=Ceraceosorus bombacis TaxID=401625 RepID=A0A0N7L8R9_9BASI|nr:3-ketoacyl-reductase [Ceraceosorus bombacis]